MLLLLFVGPSEGDVHVVSDSEEAHETSAKPSRQKSSLGEYEKESVERSPTAAQTQQEDMEATEKHPNGVVGTKAESVQGGEEQPRAKRRMHSGIKVEMEEI